jgi:hypothetical protein
MVMILVQSRVLLFFNPKEVRDVVRSSVRRVALELFTKRYFLTLYSVLLVLIDQSGIFLFIRLNPVKDCSKMYTACYDSHEL